MGFVLAGGRSSRMGADKSLELLAGQPLVGHALDLLRQAGLMASIAGARSQLAAFAPVVEDLQPGLGPLAGVCTALASTSAARSVFVSVDLPLLPASLIVFLLHHARATGATVTVCSVNGFPQTFPAVVCQKALPALQNELEMERRGCFSGFQVAASSLNRPLAVLPVELLVQSGHVVHRDALPPAWWFLNVNTPLDLRRAADFHASRLA